MDLENVDFLNKLIDNKEAPEWMTVEGYTTLKSSLLPHETPKQAYKRIAKSAAKYIPIPEIPDLENKFFNIMWKGWLGPATPVLSNAGTDKGFTISCYTNNVGDSMDEITGCLSELAILSKNSGGVGVVFSRVRPRGSLIKNGLNGKSDGIVPFIKMYDVTTIAVNQGSRRGATSINVDVDHGDFEEFLRIKRPEGDINRQCHNIHQCAVISDDFMKRVIEKKDPKAREIWSEIMKTRIETGEPYIMYKDTTNRANPIGYKNLGLEVEGTNICTEITLHTSSEYTFVCCLSSLNLINYEEWKDTDTVFLSIIFLNGILNEFIDRASKYPSMKKAVASAVKSRAIGLGVMGWHSLLQQKMMPFDGFKTMQLNNEIFKYIKEESEKSSRYLAKILNSQPEWCVGTDLYNSHLIALAPTRSNSAICKDVSASIEPYTANIINDKTAKGLFIRKNRFLIPVLEKHGKNDDKTWKSISENMGSVQHLSFLSEEEKLVFLTAYEIDQMAIIRQASQRQKYICQGQSINLFFPMDVSPSLFNKVHLSAWEMGLKTLYYCRSQAGIKVSHTKIEDNSCVSCEG